MERRDDADVPAAPESDPPGSDAAAPADPDRARPAPTVPGLDALRARLAATPTRELVVGVALVALAARLAFLGARTAHWDEARVAHWVLHYNEFGHFAYRPIIHGPLVQHVDQVLVSVLGATDAVVRLPVAVAGAALPLTAYLFRDHLDRDELVAMALFLAANSVLLYYSRFMRSDVLVAAAMFGAFGCLLRLYDTRRVRYLYAAGLLVALGFGAKENAVVYVLTWVGAAALLADTALYRPRRYATGWRRLTASRAGRHALLLAGSLVVGPALAVGLVAPFVGSTALALLVGLWLGVGLFLGVVAQLSPDGVARTYARYAGHAVGAGLLCVVVLVYLFAPRGDGLAGVYMNGVPQGRRAVGTSLWTAVGRPLSVPGYAVEVLSYAADEYASWFGRSAASGESVLDTFADYFSQYLEVLALKATAVVGFGVFGVLYERYATDGSRNVVQFLGYIAAVSAVGYPLGTDIFGAWTVVHTVVPLSVPAGVGLARVIRWGRSAAASGDPASALLFAGPAVVVTHGLVSGLAGALPVALATDLLAVGLLPTVALGVALVVAGLALRGGGFVSDADTVLAGAVAGLLVVAALQVGAVGVGSVYQDHSERDNVLVQYAQPADDLDPLAQRLSAVAPAHDSGPDLVVYAPDRGGESFVRDPEASANPLIFRPLCTNWPETLPLNWYITRADADVVCRTPVDAGSSVERPPAGDVIRGESGLPPLVLARSGELDGLNGSLAAQYERSTYGIRTYGSEVTVLVHENWTADARAGLGA